MQAHSFPALGAGFKTLLVGRVLGFGFCDTVFPYCHAVQFRNEAVSAPAPPFRCYHLPSDSCYDTLCLIQNAADLGSSLSISIGKLGPFGDTPRILLSIGSFVPRVGDTVVLPDMDLPCLGDAACSVARCPVLHFGICLQLSGDFGLSLTTRSSAYLAHNCQLTPLCAECGP